MFNVSCCFRSFSCGALIVVGCMPVRTEAVSTKSLLAGVVGITALGASQAGPISGLIAYGTTQVCGWLMGGALTGLAAQTAATAAPMVGVIGATVGVATVGVASTVAAGTAVVGTVTTAVVGYGAAVQASATAVGAFFTALPFLP